MKINEIENFEFPSMVAKSIRRKKRKDIWGWLLVVSLVAFGGALWFFHYEVIMPHLESIVPTANAMTNEEACELLKEGAFIGADSRAQEYCYGN